ncbi:MAG: TIM barrel protein [Actinobacteria bacterium]|nr:TIM barrel protein [Actinomycetota bacterium]
MLPLIKNTIIIGLILLFSIVLPMKAQSVDLSPELKIGGFYLGPQAWSFHKLTFYKAVDNAKALGCNVIEAFPGQKLSPTDSTPFDHNAAPAVWAKAKLKAEATGVKIINYGVVGFSNEAELRKVFDFAKVMDIPAITIEPHDTTPKMFDTIEKLAIKYDIKVGIHNHPKRANKPDYKFWDPNFVLSLVKNRDHHLGATIDTGHWIRSGIKPLDGMKILKGRIISVHLKDLNEFSLEAHDVPYGTGVGNIAKVLKELKAQHFNGNISIEYEYNWNNNLPDMKKCVDFVREQGMVNP